MSVAFAISPLRPGAPIAEDDARRVRMARRVTAARLRYCGLHAMVDDVTLIVSELVTNAIVHSGGAQITFTMTVRDDVLRLAVHDEMAGGPTICEADSDSERGRGLFLVGFLTEEHSGKWGTSDEGATTWCALPLAGAQR
ncbi:ATP-binding protein [Streptomyces sp. NPDC001621]|uniref:ATP-binding protein n=1 Tax=Streptomyces sp. NPDC001621 TaxID=3364594 RepID=UPI0036778729